MSTFPKKSNTGQWPVTLAEELIAYQVATKGGALITSVDDRPFGICEDGGDAAADVQIAVFGQGPDTAIGIAAAAITDGAFVTPSVDGSGELRAVPAAPGTYWIVGRALEAAAAGDYFAVEDCEPYQLQTTGIQSISETVAIADFTDATDATGYVDLATDLPIGAIPIGGKAVVTTGFAGDTSAALDVGIAADPDKFLDNISVLAAATVYGDPAVVSTVLTAAATPRVTVTGASDFGLITAGSMTITLYYIQL